MAELTHMKNSLSRRVAILAVSAIVLATLFVIVSMFFVMTHAGQSIDQRAFNGASFGQRSVAPAALRLLDAIPITGVAIALVVAVAIVFVRRNIGVFFVALLAAGAASLTTQIVKRLILDRPALGVPGYAENSLPSGHTALAAASVLVVFLVSSPQTRPLVATIGAFFCAGVGISTLVNQWHRPSDVVAALLIVGFFGCLAGLVLIWFRYTEEAPARDLLSRGLLLLSLPCAGLALTTFFVSAFAPLAYVGSAAGVATCALLLAAAANHAFRFIR